MTAQRKRVRRALSRKAQMTAPELARRVRCTRNAMTKVLRRMVYDGLVRVEQRPTGHGGVENVYSLAPKAVPLLQIVWRGLPPVRHQHERRV